MLPNNRAGASGVLHHHQHRAAPFAAETDALKESQHDQEHRRGDPDLLIGRNRPIRKVPMPMTMIVIASIALRPTRSPKWPKIAAPSGRARKPTA